MVVNLDCKAMQIDVSQCLEEQISSIFGAKERAK
jgi:hypothetical protein